MREERRTTPRNDEGGRPLPVGARLEPPRLDRGQILRPRLLAVLAQRWDRRATVVVAGAGFGKSTLLGQAMAENLLAPRGVDLWLSLTVADRDESTLLHALTSALASVLPTSGPVDPTLGTLVSQLSTVPPGTCLVIDDLHFVEPGSSGHRVLERLVTALPLQCSLLLGSRVEPALPLADWRAKGLVETLDERALAYDQHELDELAVAKGRRPTDLSGLGGWPALVELSLAVGRDGSEPYLRQVVLDRLTARQQRWLGALHAIGGGGLELVSAALGEPTEAANPALRAEFATLGSLPAMQVIADGGFQPHALWQDTLSRLVTVAEARDAQRRAAVQLLGRGDHDRAFELYRRSGDVEGMCAVVVDSCTSGTWRYPVHTLQRWRDLLPPEAADRPEAQLLAALTGREGATFDAATVSAIVHAAMAFRERGDIGAEVAALAELAFVSREQGNTDAFGMVATRLFELLAEGRREVEGFVALVHATLAEAADLDQMTLDALADLDRLLLPRQWRSRAHWLRAHSTVMLGRPADALDDASRSLEVAEDDFLGGRYLMAYIAWWQGVDQVTLSGLPFIGDERYRTPFDCVYGGGIFAALHAFAGSIDRAEESLRIAVEAAGAMGADGLFARPEYTGILQTSRAALDVARGNEAEAASVLQAFFAEHPTDTSVGRRVARRLPALVDVLVPTERDALATAPFGPAHDEVREVGRWFTALREGAPVLPPSNWPNRLLNALPFRWAVEAAARSFAVDPAISTAIADHLIDLQPSMVRSQLREFEAGHEDDRVATGARRLLGSVPIRPEQPVRLSLFGATAVSDGAAVTIVEHPLATDAKMLIAALAALGPVDGSVFASSIWPGLAESESHRRLGETLEVAHELLEPRRRPEDAPFLLREVGGQLSLAPRPWIETDLAAFEHAVERADEANRAGSHSNELEFLEEALRVVTGAPLADLAAHPPAASTIERLAATVIRSGYRASALRFARGDHGTARLHASTVLAVDPSNEACHQIIVASFADEGRTAAALDAFRTWQEARSALGLDPSAEMTMLARRLGLQDRTPALASAEPVRHTDAGTTLHLLGRFAATVGGRDAAIPGGKPQELVKLLAVSGRPIPEDEACDVLWPGADPDIGRRRLRNVIARVRAAGPFIERGDGLLALADMVAVDLRRFEAAARAALRGDGAVDVDAVFADFGGELLPADRFVDWTEPPRQRVRALAVQLLESAVERASRADDTSTAIGAIDRLLDIDPFAVHWARRAAEILRAAGQAGAAVHWDERAAHIDRQLDL